ncbi:putative nuclease HARBI1 [Dermacentor andersoni]|uniref:putative nuclease HARBI1 n=1 Tax=Dermacentor andersoni TaxID=34620 RepID=UPI003B3BB996
MAALLIALAAAARQPGRGRREPEDAFDMPEDLFRRHLRLKKETLRWLCDEVAEELGGVRTSALSVERQVLCALRFFATGSFQASVRSEETIGVTKPAVSKCVRRVAEAIVHAGARNKWVHFPRTSEENAAVKEGFLRRGFIPGVIGCVDGSLIAIIAPKGEQKAAFMCRKGYYALTTMFHASMRSVVERCIGLLKSRFRCLQRYRALHYEPDRTANIVAACAVLHNLCLDEGDVLLDDVSDDSSSSSSDDESGNPSPEFPE